MHIGPSARKFEEKKLHLKALFRIQKSSFPLWNPQKRPEYDNFGLFLQPSIIPFYKKLSIYFKSIDFLSKKLSLCLLNFVFIDILSF
jgi:hypothetical protein